MSRRADGPGRPMRRVLLALIVVAIAAVAVYWFALRGPSTPTAEAKPTAPVAQIGEGKTVIVVGDDGRLLGTRTSEDNKKGGGEQQKHLVVLALKKRPKADRVTGHVLEEVHVIAAAPSPIRRYIANAKYGKTGVALTTNTGIEIRFGDDRETSRKWEAAAALLADPSVTLLSYVDVTAPNHPAVGGKDHELPAAN
jgi:hypothetical protein